MVNEINGREYMTTAEAAVYLGVNQSRVRQLKMTGVFKETITIGRATLILKADVDAYKDQQAERQPPKK